MARDDVALFFDQRWFEERLDAAGLTKPDLARALGLTSSELEAMWKDQREISDKEIKTLALLLGSTEVEVRKKGGIQGSPEARALALGKQPSAPITPAPDIEARLSRIETLLEEILNELKRR